MKISRSEDNLWVGGSKNPEGHVADLAAQSSSRLPAMHVRVVPVRLNLQADLFGMSGRVVRDCLDENSLRAEGPLYELHHQESLVGGLSLALLNGA